MDAQCCRALHHVLIQYACMMTSLYCLMDDCDCSFWCDLDSEKCHCFIVCHTHTHTHTHRHRQMAALEAHLMRTHTTAAAAASPAHSVFAATADPPPDWHASLQAWSATISTHACTHQKVSDGEVAVPSSYVKAHIVTDKESGQERRIVGTDT